MKQVDSNFVSASGVVILASQVDEATALISDATFHDNEESFEKAKSLLLRDKGNGGFLLQALAMSGKYSIATMATEAENYHQFRVLADLLRKDYERTGQKLEDSF